KKIGAICVHLTRVAPQGIWGDIAGRGVMVPNFLPAQLRYLPGRRGAGEEPGQTPTSGVAGSLISHLLNSLFGLSQRREVADCLLFPAQAVLTRLDSV